MAVTHQTAHIDWTACALVESIPGKVSGVPIVQGTRVQADAILENYDGGSPIAEISENFAIPEVTIRTLLTFAENQRAQSPS